MDEAVKKVNSADTKELKKCFVVTPIGDAGTAIRRTIEGIIEQAIKPALSDRFVVEASHHMNKPGTITDQVVKRLYEDDLVIVNLMWKNPNVMFELALRYAFGKPVILIIDEETDMPFDIAVERCIVFKADILGMKGLESSIKKFADEIDFDGAELASPIHDSLRNSKIIMDTIFEVGKTDSGMANTLKLMAEEINDIKSAMEVKEVVNEPINSVMYYQVTFSEKISQDVSIFFLKDDNCKNLSKALFNNFEIDHTRINYEPNPNGGLGVQLTLETSLGPNYFRRKWIQSNRLSNGIAKMIDIDPKYIMIKQE